MRRIFVIGLLLLGAAFSRGGTVTHAEQWEKVLAPKGMFDEEQLWHDYGAFGLYRISAETLQSLSPTDRAAIQTSAQLDTLHLTAQTFDTQRDPINSTTRSTGTTQSGHKLSLVQFVGPIKQAWLDELEKGGIRPIHYVSQNAYLVWTDDAGRARLQAESRRAHTIQYVVDYLPDFKLDATLRQRSDSRAAIPVTVQLIQHAEDGQTKRLIEEFSAETLTWQPILQFQNAQLTLSSAEIEQLLERPDLFWIGERLPRKLYDEVQAQIVAGNLDGTQAAPASTGYLAWLDGLEFSQDSADYPIVDIVDDGLGNGNAANGAGDVTLTALGDGSTTRLTYVANCTNAANGEGLDGHGHINASIAGGYDQRSGFPFRDPLGYQRGQGINPYGRFAGTRIFSPSGFSLAKCGNSDVGLIKSQQDSGAVISSNSWGVDNNGGYDDLAQIFDVGVRDADLNEVGNQAMIMVVAAGNQGAGAATVGTPATAKNVIAVGAGESFRPNDEDGTWLDGCGYGATDADDAMDIATFSSRGPVQGGRIKPDLVAPGTHIQGTASTSSGYNGSGICDIYRPSGQTTFAASSGTSHSTPAVAGAASLYYHWLENNHALTPSPAMMKAYLVAHPTYLTGDAANDTLPSNAQGYGMPDMTTAFDDTTRQLVDQTVTFDDTGETWTFTGDVADAAKPVRVVLAWTDAAGALNSAPDVNNLNLAANVDGTIYRGNVFNGQWSVAGGSADSVNNVEAIYLPAGTTGAITVTVTAANIAGDGVPNRGDGTDQDFALVCYNCAAPPDFTLTATPSTLASCIANDATFTLNVGAISNFADPVTLAAQLPLNATGDIATNPVTPPDATPLTIDTQNMAVGSYTIPITGTASAKLHATTVTMTLAAALPSAPMLQLPTNNASDQSLLPMLAWADAGAASYTVMLATDAAFSNVVISDTVTATSYKVTSQLESNRRYYWRVLGENGCGVGDSSATFSFRTGVVGCTLYPSSNVPLGIPTDVATITSTLNIATMGDILDLNVRDLAGTHSAVGDLAFTLVSPTSASADLFGNICSTQNDFAVEFDDDAVTSTLPCPPTDEGIYRPISPLATFNGSAMNGNWSLVINDDKSFDGGSLNSWGLEICTTVAAPPPDFDLQITPTSAEICLPDPSTHTVSVVPISEFSDQVTLGATGLPVGISAEFAQTTITNATTLTVTAANDTPSGNYTLDVTGSTPTTTHTTTLPITVAPHLPTSVTLNTPASGASDVSTTPLFDWEDSTAATAYRFELATSPSFAAPITDTTVTQSQFSLATPLDLNTVYYWRVTPINVCGETAATVGNFVTQAGSLSCGNGVTFEDGIPTDWDVVGVSGVEWVRSDSAECNNLGNRTGGTGFAACANRDRLGSGSFPYDTILTSNAFDLSATQAATLTLQAYYFDSNFNGDDGFAVERFDGAQWVTLLDSSGTTINGDTRSFPLPPNTTQLRFRYFGDGWDYYAQVDDVALSCVAAGAVTTVQLASNTTTRTANPQLIWSIIVLLSISILLRPYLRNDQ